MELNAIEKKLDKITEGEQSEKKPVRICDLKYPK